MPDELLETERQTSQRHSVSAWDGDDVAEDVDVDGFEDAEADFADAPPQNGRATSVL